MNSHAAEYFISCFEELLCEQPPVGTERGSARCFSDWGLRSRLWGPPPMGSYVGWRAAEIYVFIELKAVELWELRETHHSISHGVAVGPQLGVDVGEEPAERATLEPGSQGLPLRNIPDVYSWVLGNRRAFTSVFTCFPRPLYSQQNNKNITNPLISVMGWNQK